LRVLSSIILLDPAARREMPLRAAYNKKKNQWR